MTRKTPLRRTLTLGALALLVASQLGAAMVLRMDLAEMCQRADTIYRGTVVAITPGTVELGGTELPTVTYRLAVSDVFKGDLGPVKDGVQIAEVTMLGVLKNVPQGDLEHVSLLPELPQLEEGRDYVLLATAPSAAGLQAPVGLGQGTFDIYSLDKVEVASNKLGNQGIFDGPVTYDELAQTLRDILGAQQ